jgi:hypothetical protein
MYSKIWQIFPFLYLPFAMLVFGCDALVDADSFQPAINAPPDVILSVHDIPAAHDIAEPKEEDLSLEPEMASGQTDLPCVDCGECALAPPFGPAQRMIFLAVGDGGHPGEGVDVDGDPDTCAPLHDCEAGLNNQLSGLFGVVEDYVSANGELTSALSSGDLNLVLEWGSFKGEDVAFDLTFHPAVPDLPKESCDWQLESCDFSILEESLDPETCLPLVVFHNAVISDGKLTAGETDNIFIFQIPLSDSAQLELVMRVARLEGTVISGADGRYIVGGLIGGAIRRDDIVAAIQQIPDTAYLPVGKETLITLLDLFVVPDVDTDADGNPDAVSLGLKFEARPATITSLKAGGTQ